MKQHDYNGFSLVELIIVILILSILTVIVFPVIQTGFDSYYLQRNLNNADWQGRLAFARMTRDIRDLPSSGSITTATSSQLAFVDSQNNVISYSLSGNNLLRNSNILADGVGSLDFTYYDNAGAVTAVIANIRYIKISLLITQNNTDLWLEATINLRNIVS